jgi:hypothetical protein
LKIAHTRAQQTKVDHTFAFIHNHRSALHFAAWIFALSNLKVRNRFHFPGPYFSINATLQWQQLV